MKSAAHGGAQGGAHGGAHGDAYGEPILNQKAHAFRTGPRKVVVPEAATIAWRGAITSDRPEDAWRWRSSEYG